jgi:hypothetical protein
MSVRYVSYDIQKGNDYEDLRAFIKKHKGEAITKSLYRFDTEVSLQAFRSELGEASDGDDSVVLIIRTKDGIAHGRATPRKRARSAR